VNFFDDEGVDVRLLVAVDTSWASPRTSLNPKAREIGCDGLQST